ncbi:TMEM175 family protein [Nocardioides panaciterrulae]|uniref:Putative membrane protein n=1 Tax=Nocardioides panaciterrulae TaxID=661492 RepID=A0A7Y9JBT3_9ACTN|nr:TMEM175 family protein [Nocardioides panaciterrulae]NYD42683.1 putative membrane protein [Nocardioides panaciterrulae]
MRTSRLEAFSDGVLAIIITIMVLELHVPDGPRLADLADSATGFLTYVLSFVYIGIYWNNHHHMFQLVRRVNGTVLWANLHLLFWLSLYPFTTAWMDETDLARTPLVAYGLNLLAAALAYYLLQLAIFRAEGADGLLREAVGRDVKGKVSPLIYLAGTLAAWLAGWPALVFYAVVAAIWLVPDRRMESYVAEHGLTE